jgi:SpoVK/Ycf46/Vps4 family AAA+-type ATPase
MSKKKKKSRASSETPTSETSKSPARNNVLVEKPLLLDLVSLQMVKSSSASNTKTLKYTPQIVLTEQDADRLDVFEGDEVILISTRSREEEDTFKSPDVVGTAIAQVKTTLTRPSSTTNKMTDGNQKSKLTPGHCHVFPLSLANCLSGEDDHQTQPPPRTPQTPTSPLKTPTSKPLLESPSPPPPPPPPSSKSKFSFAKGGGGDFIISPSSKMSITTPSKRSSPAACQLWVIPLDSGLGTQLSQLICQDATRISISDPPKRLLESEQIGKRLLVAHTAGAHLGMASVVKLSFQGQAIECSIADIQGGKSEDQEDLTDELATLTLKDDVSEEQTALVSAMQSAMKDTKQAQNLRLYKISYCTRVILGEEDVQETEILNKPLVAGLDATLEQVQSILSTTLRQPHLFTGTLRPPRGVLLHGPGGVGKSCLVQQVAQNLQSTVHIEHVNCTSLQSLSAIVGQAERRLAQIFHSAEQSHEGKTGSLIILDDVHLICPRRRGMNPGADRLAATLLALLDGIGSSNPASIETATVMILAVTTNPSLLDPALRRPGRLDSEVEVPLPDEPTTRAEILQFQVESLGVSAKFSDTQWLSLARLAKGFTGADCKLAVKEAIRSAMLQSGKLKLAGTVPVTLVDLEKAIRLTKPSAIKSVTVEIPQVLWSSIGGMEKVKRELREAIELPLTHGHIFQQLQIRPPRGVLLYGPPGCSKTLMARALATEGHMNFLAVKGPELLSKWLGESERALASLFKRARLASPAVIFFDEIDAIASKRGGSSSGGERLLSQLLTELDGIQNGQEKDKNKRVVVVGATNRPDLLDSALMRPGRIDRMIYVGVPDEASRTTIFQIGLQGKACASDIDVSSNWLLVPL